MSKNNDAVSGPVSPRIKLSDIPDAVPAVTGVPDDGTVTLGAVEAAYVAMIEQEYRAAIVDAQQLRSARFTVVMQAHNIRDGSTVTVVPGENGFPMQLRVVTPEAMPS